MSFPGACLLAQVPCVCNDFIGELLRGIRLHFTRFIDNLKDEGEHPTTAVHGPQDNWPPGTAVGCSDGFKGTVHQQHPSQGVEIIVSPTPAGLSTACCVPPTAADFMATLLSCRPPPGAVGPCTQLQPCQGEVQCEQGGQHGDSGHCSAGYVGQGHQHLHHARPGVVQLALP